MAANYFMIRERDTVELHGFEDVEKKLFIRFLHNNDLAFVVSAHREPRYEDIIEFRFTGRVIHSILLVKLLQWTDKDMVLFVKVDGTYFPSDIRADE